MAIIGDRECARKGDRGDGGSKVSGIRTSNVMRVD